MLIENNTVAAQGQMKNSSHVSFLGDPNATKRILVVGNSITRHGPNAEIGWGNRDWGMAASAPEKDFVHLLYSMLQSDGQDIFMRVSQCAEWERNFRDETILSNYDEDRAFNADIVVFRLGENVAKDNKPFFQNGMRKFVEHICPNGTVLFTTCFWENPIIDDAIEQIANERGEICIDCGFSVDEATMAIGEFEHKGVAHHPSDAGMEKIAKAIFEQLKSDKEKK